MMTLVTGANGFIGSALAKSLNNKGVQFRGSVRSLSPDPCSFDVIPTGSINGETDWSLALQDTHRVVHLAAHVHVMDETNADSLAQFRAVNVAATVNLAQQAADRRVKRFIYLSSVKVNGESTRPGRPFLAEDNPAPEDPYGISKLEAEQALLNIAAQTNMEVVIIRPPLVYGPGVRANFYSLMNWLSRGLPLPLAAITKNRRSLVALDNLIDLIMTCLDHPQAANQTFLVSDGEDVSTAELLKRMGIALGKPAHLFYVPSEILRLGATFCGKNGIYQRLCGSLQVDIRQTRELLNWAPPISVEEGLRRTAQEFLK